MSSNLKKSLGWLAQAEDDKIAAWRASEAVI